MQATDQVNSAPQKIITLWDIITRVESGSKKGRFRFEPTVYAHFQKPEYCNSTATLIDKIARINECSRDTAKMVYSTSWGAAQIMGFNMYTICGVAMNIGEFLNDESQQKIAFDAFVSFKKIHYTPMELAADYRTRENLAVKYNGSINYLGPLCDAMRALGLTIISQAEFEREKHA